MAFIKEDSEDLKIEETFKHEDPEQLTVDYEEVRSDDGLAEAYSVLSSESEEEEEDLCQHSRQPIKHSADLESDSPPPKLQKRTQTVKAEVLHPPADSPPASALLSPAPDCDSPAASPLPLLSAGIEQYIVSSLEEIKLRLTALERAVASISRSKAKEVMLPGGVLLPLQDYQDLQSLELRMEDAQCQKDLTAYLGTIGGCNIQIATRRILTTLIGHNLATKLNWTGSNQKKPFQNLRLKRVVTESVRMCGFQPSPLDSDIENEIKVWLRNSRDRAGGRKQRYLRMLTS
ncbi:uncharacterized protein si:dkey-172k15.5 [Danio aesculapii]|uniref:uncharacterized protein si:dkey-172k15.5 n=1 Tax=Danio aesculapii TaxID=1142201 RepID=UPI0024C09004|nr:uncharacterized protein si:dkey-172k15.5 [Danio aesculapii]